MERMNLIGKVKPLSKDAVKCERFGIGLEKLDRNTFDPSKTYDYIAELGMKYVRIQSGWMRTEKEEGIYDFKWLDEIVDNLRSRGMQPWMCLCYGNPLYTEMAKEVYGAVGCPPIATERERNAWAKYCKAVAEHFRGRVDMYEVWNEPDGKWCWKHGVSGKEYGEFCIATAKAVKEACPEAKILGGSFCIWENGFSWLEDALQSGMYKYIDAITYHEYTIDELHIFERVSSLRALLEKYGDIKIIQGESGSPSSSKGSGALHTGAFTPEKQAKLILRRAIVDMMTGVWFSSIFTTVDMIEALNGTVGDLSSYLDYGYFGLLGANFDENGFAVGNYTPKPSYYAYQNFCGLFGDGAELCEMPIIFLPKWTERQMCVDQKRSDLITAGFKKKNGSKAFVYWKPTHLLSTTFDGLVSFQSAGLLGDVKLVDMMTGEVYKIPDDMAVALGRGVLDFRHLPVRDYPLVLTFGDFFEMT